MDVYGLLLGALCVWRVTHLLNAEDGPWDLLVRLRRRAGDGFWGDLLDCFYCASLWVAAPFAALLADDLRERLLLWPALSGAAILLERITHRGTGAPPVLYTEDEEDDDVLLRQTESPAQRSGPQPETR
jgi:hypothetical protein